MGKKKEDFELLSAELAGAKDGFDHQALAQKVLAALGLSEKEVADAMLEITKLGTDLNANEGELKTLQLAFDKQGVLIVQLQADTKEANEKLIAANLELDQKNILVEKLQADLQNAEEDLTDALSQVSDLGTQLAITQEGAGKPGLMVMVGKEPHRLHGNRFSFKGKPEMTAAQVAKDKDLLQQLKDTGSGALVPEPTN